VIILKYLLDTCKFIQGHGSIAVVGASALILFQITAEGGESR
jgi:hypothetical protein